MTEAASETIQNRRRDLISAEARRELSSLAERLLGESRISLVSKIADILAEVAPSRPQALQLKGLLAYNQGQRSSARVIFEDCLRIHPDSAVALRYLLRLTLEEARYDDASTIISSYSVDDACKDMVVAAADGLIGRQRSSEALTLLIALISGGANDPNVFIRASRLLVGEARYDENRSILEVLRQVRPHNVYGYLANVHELAGRGEYDAACAELTTLLPRFGSQPALVTLLLEVTIKQGHYSEALLQLAAAEGVLPGPKLLEYRIELLSRAQDWTTLTKMAGETATDGLSNKALLSFLYASIFEKRFELADALREDLQRPARSTPQRWIEVSHQVSQFMARTGHLPTDASHTWGRSRVSSIAECPPVVRTLWVGGALSPIETLCLKSWVDHGFALELYTYGDIDNVPAGVLLANAEEILPRSRIFTHAETSGRSMGSYAGFADIFRWNLLRLKGGFWTDCDVICLQKFDLPDDLAIASESARTGYVDHPAVTNCFFGGAPEHPLFVAGWKACQSYSPQTMQWGEYGTSLIGRLVTEMSLEHAVLPHHRFNRFGPYDILGRLFSVDDAGDSGSLSSAWGLHLYNEVWRTSGRSKWKDFPRDTFLHNLFAKHDVRVQFAPPLWRVPDITSVLAPDLQSESETDRTVAA